MDRLTATFGVDAVSGCIVSDPGYNAALVPSHGTRTFFVTDALMRDFDLIELEGVVAHCLARQRLGLCSARAWRRSPSRATSRDEHSLVTGLAYRADEVAAAAIRYPLGLGGGARRCAGQDSASTSFFAGATYAAVALDLVRHVERSREANSVT